MKLPKYFAEFSLSALATCTIALVVNACARPAQSTVYKEATAAKGYLIGSSHWVYEHRLEDGTRCVSSMGGIDCDWKSAKDGVE